MDFLITFRGGEKLQRSISTWKQPGKLQPLGEGVVHNSIVGYQNHSGDATGCKKLEKYSLGERALY